MKTTLSFIAALGMVIFIACTGNNKTSNKPETYPVVALEVADTFTQTDYIAEIHAIQNVEMRARVTGYLEKIHVDEGANVRKGQLLFSINNREYLEELSKARAGNKSALAEVNAAELELKNVLHLSEKKIVSATEVAMAKNKLEAAKARKEEADAHQAYAEIKLSNTHIRAPFDGTINRVPHKIGSLIEEGTLLTSISEFDEIYAYFDVSEKEYLSYARNLKSDLEDGKAVSLVLADGSMHPHQGFIETVEGAIDEKTGNIAFRARFPNPEMIVKHGASGKVRLKKKFQKVLLVPQKSTFEIQDKLYVVTVDSNNRVAIKNIHALERMPHLFIVNNGLAAGERIVFEGVQALKSGTVIHPEERKMKSIIQELKGKE